LFALVDQSGDLTFASTLQPELQQLPCQTRRILKVELETWTEEPFIVC
jgi:hypothetical protein